KKERLIIHQKKRLLEIKKEKLIKLNQRIKSNRITLCFGTKKLFKAQYNLEANGYTNHGEWLSDWRKARNSNFLMVGAKTYNCGNQLCRLDSLGNLIITVPPCLIKEFGNKVSCSEIKFRYGQEWIDIALTPTKHQRGHSYRNGSLMPVTHRFVKRNSKWYLHTTVELPDIPTISNRNNGAVGVDLNVNNLAWAYCDSEGNLKDQGQINYNLRESSSGQITHILSSAIGEIIEVATKYQCPIVIEKLDFAQKKASLREYGKHYALMLSQFAYSKFQDLVKSKARLKAIEVLEVNPAYSTLIGLTKDMSLYGLNSGTAAALVLARRGLRFSERLSRRLYAFVRTRILRSPQNREMSVSPVDETKHVWSYWARISKLLKGCRRHSFFGMRVRVGVNTSIGYAGGTPAPLSVKLDGREPSNKSRPQLRSNDAPVILSDITALDITAT
ncbi:MAG: IS200/IS605 family accessory protein TnpB-related protein, partial [Xenococcus sp. (in: cyanobacteria)]